MTISSNGKRWVHNSKLYNSSCIQHEGAGGEYPSQGMGCWSAWRDKAMGKVFQISVSKEYYLETQQTVGACVSWIVMNISPSLYFLLLSSNQSKTVLQPRILHCQPFKNLARCCCIVLVHHKQSQPSLQPRTAQILYSALPTNLPPHTGFPLHFSFFCLHIHLIFVSFLS